MNLQELFSDASKWTQGAPARDKHGIGVGSNAPSAVCWCLSGGILKVSDASGNYYNKVWRLFQQEFPSAASITAWNDSSKRTFEDVQRFVTKYNL